MTETDQDLKLKSSSEKGYTYLSTIGVFSAINSIINLFSQNYSFIIGLGITQLLDGIFSVKIIESLPDEKSSWASLNMLSNIIIVSSFFLMSYFVKKQNIIIFSIAILLYMVDGFLFFFAEDYVSIAFHLIFIFFMTKSLIAMIKLKKLNNHLNE